MFHAGGHKGLNTRGRSSALSRHSPHFVGHLDWKRPLRCGILFLVFTCVLFVVGIILTWLGVHDMFGETVPITGPILLSVGGLMMILALRQFYLTHNRKRAHDMAIKNKELAVTAVAAAGDPDEDSFLTDVDGNRLKDGMYEPLGSTLGVKASLNSNDTNVLSSPCADKHITDNYNWPPVALQHPYYSMALMVYKDPALICLPCITSPVPTSSLITSPIYDANTNREQQEDSNKTLSGSPTSSPLLKQRDSAVLVTSSVTLQQQKSPSFCSPSTTDSMLRLESSKIFPADYLRAYKNSGSVGNSALAGISNLPNPTAFMMLRTLELQETI